MFRSKRLWISLFTILTALPATMAAAQQGNPRTSPPTMSLSPTPNPAPTPAPTPAPSPSPTPQVRATPDVMPVNNPNFMGPMPEATPSSTQKGPIAKPPLKSSRTLPPKGAKFVSAKKPLQVVKNYRRTFSLGYFSWYEKASVSLNGQSINANAAMFGNMLGFQWEHYFRRWTLGIGTNFYYGAANVGQSQTTPTYELVGQNWYGLGLNVPIGFRITRLITTYITPMAVYRSITLPNDPNSGAGASLNGSFLYGITWGLRMQYAAKWDVHTELGSFILPTQTYWSIAVGYSL